MGKPTRQSTHSNSDPSPIRVSLSWLSSPGLPLPSGSGAAEPPACQPGGEGLCEGLPQLYLRVHLQQLPRAVRPRVPDRPGEARWGGCPEWGRCPEWGGCPEGGMSRGGGCPEGGCPEVGGVPRGAGTTLLFGPRDFLLRFGVRSHISGPWSGLNKKKGIWCPPIEGLAPSTQ